MNFSIVGLTQDSEKWLQWRQNGIGASDAATIMGENKYSTYANLLVEKITSKVRKKPNEAMVRGKRFEPRARDSYIKRTGISVSPHCIQSLEFEWMRASLDGFSENLDSAVEIKCGKSTYAVVKKHRDVPRNYFGQLQHILAITGFDKMDLWCYSPPNSPIRLSVNRNERYIETLIKREKEFWQRVQDSK